MQSLEEDLDLISTNVMSKMAKLQAEVANNFESMESFGKRIIHQKEESGQGIRRRQIQGEFKGLQMETMQIQVNLVPSNDKGHIWALQVWIVLNLLLALLTPVSLPCL